MGARRCWDPCIVHRGDEVETFIAEYFGQVDRKALLVAGAGFDPRACIVANRLGRTASHSHMRTLLVKEQRPNPRPHHVERADANTRALRASVREAHIEAIQIFGSDGAVVGGRNVIKALGQQRFEGLTDIVVDISALSVGTSFPIIRYLAKMLAGKQATVNLHVFVAHDPEMDAAIRPISSDAPGYVHGFRGGSTLSTAVDVARLWLPQLATGRRAAVRRLYDFVDPHDTCPILPFPASDPRLGDVLAEEYLPLLETSWGIDTRDIVYADEGDPLDLYRTILNLDDLRRPVFEQSGGSTLVLSPLGSKVMALGALMAALERDLPVAYLEAFDYNVETGTPADTDSCTLIHIWLEGDVYPRSRKDCYQEGGATG